MPTLEQHMTLIRLRREAVKKRIEVCKECPFAKKFMGAIWCGTPVFGEDIVINGQEVSLCGCNMKVKTKLTNAECPLKKW